MKLGGCTVVAAAALAIPIFAVLVLIIDMRIRTESKIRAVLEDRYRKHLVQIVGRADLDNQLCINVVLREIAGGPPYRRTVMVQGDLDGGQWWFGREYASMEACKRAFNRG